jgi:hypothetical protein
VLECCQSTSVTCDAWCCRIKKIEAAALGQLQTRNVSQDIFALITYHYRSSVQRKIVPWFEALGTARVARSVPAVSWPFQFLSIGFECRIPSFCDPRAMQEKNPE